MVIRRPHLPFRSDPWSHTGGTLHVTDCKGVWSTLTEVGNGDLGERLGCLWWVDIDGLVDVLDMWGGFIFHIELGCICFTSGSIRTLSGGSLTFSGPYIADCRPAFLDHCVGCDLVSGWKDICYWGFKVATRDNSLHKPHRKQVALSSYFLWIGDTTGWVSVMSSNGSTKTNYNIL